jgi:hypothetical protein
MAPRSCSRAIDKRLQTYTARGRKWSGLIPSVVALLSTSALVWTAFCRHLAREQSAVDALAPAHYARYDIVAHVRASTEKFLLTGATRDLPLLPEDTSATNADDERSLTAYDQQRNKDQA